MTSEVHIQNMQPSPARVAEIFQGLPRRDDSAEIRQTTLFWHRRKPGRCLTRVGMLKFLANAPTRFEGSVSEWILVERDDNGRAADIALVVRRVGMGVVPGGAPLGRWEAFAIRKPEVFTNG